MNPNPFLPKLRLIFLPFLLLAVSFISLYTLLHWLLFIRSQVFDMREDMLYIWMPMALSLIPVQIWIVPRLRRLTMKNSFMYFIVAWLTIAVPTMIAQSYLSAATGKLTELREIEEINSKPETRYYTLKNYFIDKNNPGFHYTYDLSGRTNQSRELYVLAALPIYSYSADTVKAPVAWLGIEYHKTIDNSLPEEEKEIEQQQFAHESREKVAASDFHGFVFLERMSGSDRLGHYRSALKRSEKFGGDSLIVLIPNHTAFEERNTDTLAWIFGTFGIGTGLWLVMLYFAKLNPQTLPPPVAYRGHAASSGTEPPENGIRDFFELLIPRGYHFITPIIINLNLLIFILMALSGMEFVSFPAADLINWGANHTPLTLGGQWWRLLTCTFLHGGIIHIAANMYALLNVGVLLESVLGRVRYAAAYLICGILASVTSLWWHEYTTSVGASGAVFGMFGLLLALLLTRLFPATFKKSMLSSMGTFLVINLGIGLMPGIDMAAHVGGLISGFIIGFLLYFTMKGKRLIEVRNDPGEEDTGEEEQHMRL